MKHFKKGWLPAALLFCQAAAAQSLMERPATEISINKAFKYAEIKTWSFMLPNGVRLVIRPDDSVKNIQVRGFSNGGAAGMAVADYASAIHAGDIIVRSGVGKFDAAALTDLLKDKKIQLAPAIGDNQSFINGACNKEDLETALQLICLYFTQPRKDPEAYNQYIQKLKETAARQQKNIFNDTLNFFLHGHDARHPGRLEEAGSISLDRVFAAYNRCFGHASGYTFVFTGDLNPNGMNNSRLAPLIARYLGALPAGDSLSRPPMAGITIPAATIAKTIYAGNDSIATASFIFSGSYEYSDSANLQLKALLWIWRQRWYNDAVNAGLHISGMNTSSRTERLPLPCYECGLNFRCPAAQAGALLQLLHATMDSLQMEIHADELARFVAFSKQTLKSQYPDNAFWTSYLVRQFMKHDDPYDIAHYPYYFRKATPRTVCETARLVWKNKPYIQVVLLPAQKQ